MKNLHNFTFIIVGGDVTELTRYIDKDLAENFLLLEPFGIDFNKASPVVPHRSLIELYKVSDLFVFPSFIETFGIVLLEAMAAGLPIVTSDVEGCRDLVIENVNGHLLDPNDDIGFSNSILAICSDNSLSKKLSRNNVNKAKQYDWDKITDGYITAYKKAILKEKLNEAI